MRRKILTIILSLLVVFACAIALVACGEGWSDWDYEYGDWYDDSTFEVVDGFRYYKGRDVNGNTIYAVYVDGAAEENNTIVIPSSYNGKPVTVFGGFETGWENITSVEIPDSVTSIGDCAFYGCSSLTGITVPNSVSNIGINAFHDCRSLTSIEIPNSVMNIGDGAFYGCSSLTSINITCGVTSIEKFVFYGCSSLTSIKISDSVTSIDDYAFAWCKKLTSIVIPNGVTSIGDNVFEACSSLTIYCEVAEQPIGWDSDWNSSDCPVVWDYKNQ